MPTLEDIEVKDVAKDAKHAYGDWFKNYMKIFLRRTLEWFIVYMFGYYNASFGWLMAPLLFLVLRDKRAKEKRIKFDIVRSLANSDEREVLNEIQRFSNLPSWVTFPDMERVEWLNKIMRQIWPYAGQYVKDLCTTTIEPAIGDALKDYKITGFKFDKIILGDTPPRFSGMKVYDDTSRHEIILDTDFTYAGDCKFEVAVSKFKAGIKDLQISGRVRVVMKPLVRQIPLVGGLQVFFLNNPDVDFNLIGIADFFDMPGLSDILRSIVVDQIANMMVLPNRYPIQLVEDINVVELKCPAPAGIIRVQIIEAKNLMKKDFGVLGTGKSDPYCVLHLGSQKFQTNTINNSVNPKWDFCCEALCDVIRRQNVLLECWDWDATLGTKADDFLGRANLDVQSIYSNKVVDMWVPLSEAKSGRIHIKATWLDLCNEQASLEQQLSEIRNLQNMTKNPLHSAVLMVWVDSAQKLNNIPDPFVRLHVGNCKKETRVHTRTNDPIFEEGFTFLVRNPKTQELLIEVIDQRTNTNQGKLQLDLNYLLKQPNLEVIGEQYNLMKATDGMATLKLTITLRILKAGEIGKDSDNLKSMGKLMSTDESSLNEPELMVCFKPPDEIQHVESMDNVEGEMEMPKMVVCFKPPSPEVMYEKIDEMGMPKMVVCHKPPSPEMICEKMGEMGMPKLVVCYKPPSPEVMYEKSEIAVTPSKTSPSGPAEDASEVRQRTMQTSGGRHGLGRMQLTVKYGARNNLVIVVHKVEKLPLEEDGEIPDPYVKVYLLPDRSRDSKRKTDVIKDDANPVWDERFEYNVEPNDLTNRTIQISVVNKKGLFRMARSSIMGQVHIDCGNLDPSDLTRWYDLAPPIDEDEE